MIDVDQFAVSIVVDEAIPMALTGDDRIAAVVLMCKRGIPWPEQARRLKVTKTAIQAWAARMRIRMTFPLDPRYDGRSETRQSRKKWS